MEIQSPLFVALFFFKKNENENQIFSFFLMKTMELKKKQFGNFIMAENLLIENLKQMTLDMLFGAYICNPRNPSWAPTII